MRKPGRRSAGRPATLGVERPSRIDRLFAEGKPIDEAMKRAVWNAIRVHRQAGQPMVIYRDGRTQWISPDDLAAELEQEGDQA